MIFLQAIVAGLMIALGSYANLMYGGVIGALIFSVGLVCIVEFKMKLYTGQIGMGPRENGPSVRDLLVIFFGNFIGVMLFVIMVRDKSIVSATAIVSGLVAQGWLRILAKSVFCGMLVHLACQGEKNVLRVVLCVMTFILCGFPHCIAVMAYLGFAEGGLNAVWVLAPIVLGNSLGALLVEMIL